MPHLHALRSDADRAAVSRIIRLAFAGTADGVQEWMKIGGDENFRVLADPSRPAEVGACLLRVPMATYVGGRSVRLLGIAGVGVAPENRGRGLARRLMQGCVRDAAEEGWPLAGLYASTHTLYRSVGFEHALHRFQYTAALNQLECGAGAGDITAVSAEDDAAVRACYADFARRFDGMLDRGPYMWHRVRKLRDAEFTGFGVRGAGGGLDGYVYLNQSRRPDGRHDLLLSDLVFNTPAAGRRLLALLADFAMMGYDVVFFGGPSHPALTLLTQQRYKVELKDSGLIRVLDVKSALSGRGYPGGLTTAVDLEVSDELLPANAGRWRLAVERGAAAVERGGAGRVRATARGLAMMLFGYATPLQAKLLGEVDGAEADLADAGAVFAAGTPWMSDMY